MTEKWHNYVIFNDVIDVKLMWLLSAVKNTSIINGLQQLICAIFVENWDQRRFGFLFGNGK